MASLTTEKKKIPLEPPKTTLETTTPKTTLETTTPKKKTQAPPYVFVLIEFLYHAWRRWLQ